MENQSKQPKEKKKVARLKANKVTKAQIDSDNPSLCQVPDSIPLLNEGELEALHRDIERVVDKTEIKNNRGKDSEIVTNILSEYLGSYFLVGYDLFGHRVIIQSTRTPESVDAIQKLAETAVMTGMIVKNAQAGWREQD